MSEAPDTTAQDAPAGLESSTYEIIRNRLLNSGNDLKARLDKLNAARKDVFGSIDTALLSTERITTEHNCVSRDMVEIGNQFLFGYNVHLGLKSEMDLSDVFSIYSFEDNTFHVRTLDIISNADFEKDFKDLFRYYKHAVFAKFAIRGPHLYMVFRVGKRVGEIKTFKWLIGESLTYVDSRSDHEFTFPPQHAFEWKRTTRDAHQSGLHPHISIENRVFVETVGGDLTIKIEDNTESGEGIYSEEVEHKDQTLDDAEIYYAIVGNIILLKIKPYQERDFRYIVFNEKLHQAIRLDSIKDACVMLPDDHGLIFSNGYYLQDGEHKTFGSDLTDMLFERVIAAPNGEDYLYVFYNRDIGVYALLQYNLINQKVDTPIICSGMSFFKAGELLCFKSQDEPQKHHAIQIWQTPYVDEDFVPHTQDGSFLNKIGNKEIVRGMAECHEVLNLINKDDSYANLYTDLVKQSGEIVDAFFWISREDTFNLAAALVDVKAAATAAVNEFDKVVRVKQNTAEQTREFQKRTKEIQNQIHHRRFEHINEFVASLSDLRTVRGNLISLRDLRYVDEELVTSLENEVAEQTERLSRSCVEFLLRPSSLEPYEQKVREEHASIESLTKVTDAKQLEENIAASASELEMLIEIVSNLKIDDATHRTTIIDNISAIFSTVNQARAVLKKKIRELASVEGVAEFNSQMKLLNQAVVNYLDICDSPEKCEEFMTKVMIQLEELEGRFAEFDEFILQLTDKREEVYNAFDSRKLALIESRNKRANTLMNAADRILKGIQSRVASFDSINDINGYFASDLMIEKVRDIIEQLKELDDSVKVDDIQSRLKTVREDAVRQLKDRNELFVDGENTIRLGTHLFSVNVQALDLTTVMRDDAICLHLTGTNFFEAIDDQRLLDTRDVWNQDVVSENRSVYRGEYLAYQMLEALGTDENPDGDEWLKMADAERAAFVQRFMGPRYSEAYTKGVHDADAGNILTSLVKMQKTIGLLKYHTQARSLASLYWHSFGDRKTKSLMTARLAGVGAITQVFADVAGRAKYVAQLQELLATFVSEYSLFDESFVDEAADYLYVELTTGAKFAVSAIATGLVDGFEGHLKLNNSQESFDASVEAVQKDTRGCFVLLRNWAQAFVATKNDAKLDDYADEVALVLMPGKPDRRHVIDGLVDAELTGIVGSHPVIDGGSYHLNYNEFTHRVEHYQRVVVPRFNDFVALKREIVDTARESMRLSEFKPRVLTSFVRNRLLNEVYLPLIGDNLAKQIGVAGEGKRTDLMGLLLLVSPPGYGKTTLMEYIANRLGLIFMKINGPALGYNVTSLDPTEATNAAAREEVEKLNLALEMGDNVMIYLDDIQHTNPEFLQKFISLCDAQRKIEGVYKGRTRTYDLRGRKVSVVMAGNPYTESGDKFQIPDMLSNRADIYNLGEIIGESSDAFEMSYLENSLTSNPVLSKLASRSQQDVYAIIKMASEESREGIDLEGNYSMEEINELVSTMQKLMRVRDVILSVNKEYIRSAAQADEYRTEPPFKLQGSYRNMNRIAEKVVAIMNDDELTSLIVSNYENDAQTLTSGTEANLLKFKEMTGLATPHETERWEDIKRTFSQNVKMRGISSDDKTGQVIAQLTTLSDGLDSIRKAMAKGVDQLTEQRAEELRVAMETTAISTAAEQESDPTAFAELLTEKLTGLEQGLSTISDSLTSGIGQFAEEIAKQTAIQQSQADAREQEAVETQQPSTKSATIDQAFVPPKESPPAPGESRVRPAEPTPVEQKITVVNRVPKTVTNILRRQFELMNAWLEPIHKATRGQRAEYRKLQEKIDACMNAYSKLIKRIDP
jgi:MoxR-like ATPase